MLYLKDGFGLILERNRQFDLLDGLAGDVLQEIFQRLFEDLLLGSKDKVSR